MAFRSMYPTTAVAGAKETNPTTATVMATSGALDSGVYNVKVVVGCSVAATFNIEIAGTSYIAYTAAGQSAEFVFENMYLQDTNTVRVLPESNITGTAAASVFVYRAV